MSENIQSSEQDRAVVVGVGGLGMAIARRLGQGYSLMLVDVDEARVQEAVAILTDEGHAVEGIQCDVSDKDSVGRLAHLVSSTGGWRVLAHVAALSPSIGTFAKILEVNLRGAALISKALLPSVNRGGAAIFVSSLAGHTTAADEEVIALLDDPLKESWTDSIGRLIGDAANPGLGYSLAKLGLMRMCRRQVVDWGARGARILSLSPGLIETPMGRREQEAQSMRESLRRQIPLGRQGTMIEIADALEFLASKRASFITGTDLLVDGGLLARLETHES